MNATVHSFPRVNDTLDALGSALEITLHAHFPQFAARSRVVVDHAPGGVRISLRTLGLPDRDVARAQEFLAELAAGDAAGHLRHMRRPPQPRPLGVGAGTGTGTGAGHERAQRSSAPVVHLTEFRRAS